MSTDKPELVSASKILASTILVGIGAAGLYVEDYSGSTRTRVAAALLTLGLYLLVGAWTGTTMGARLRSLYFWGSKIGVDPSGTEPEPTGVPCPDKATRTA